MNRIKSSVIIAVIGGFLYLIQEIPLNCLFKQFIGISCPACGMTRAFNEIMQGHLLTSFQYNILAIPLCVLLAILLFYLIKDLIFNQDNFIKKSLQLLEGYGVVILLSLLISWIVNIARGI